MITEIRLTIDRIESYAVIDNEISINMEFIEICTDGLTRDQIRSLNEINRILLGHHVHNTIKHLLDDEVNFYKLLIKRVLLGKK